MTLGVQVVQSVSGAPWATRQANHAAVVVREVPGVEQGEAAPVSTVQYDAWTRAWLKSLARALPTTVKKERNKTNTRHSHTIA